MIVKFVATIVEMSLVVQKIMSNMKAKGSIPLFILFNFELTLCLNVMYMVVQPLHICSVRYLNVKFNTY